MCVRAHARGAKQAQHTKLDAATLFSPCHQCQPAALKMKHVRSIYSGESGDLIRILAPLSPHTCFSYTLGYTPGLNHPASASSPKPLLSPLPPLLLPPRDDKQLPSALCNAPTASWALPPMATLTSMSALCVIRVMASAISESSWCLWRGTE
jgi:hypothetical protein